MTGTSGFTAARPMRVAVLASGGGTNLQALLDSSLQESPYRVVLVASDKPQAYALERARKRGVPARVISDPSDAQALLRLLQEYRVDLVVLAGYLKLVPAEVVHAFTGRIINIHPALLPAFGGAGMYGRRVHQAVLASGATVTGATVHIVDEAYDRGPIVAQWPVAVRPGDTPETLAARVLEVEHKLLPQVVRKAAEAGGVVRLFPAVAFGAPSVAAVPPEGG
ncbi:MAG: phosphoribosylglycinamide formyltransferase [Gemmatimonadales bacterium]|nr:MAG: phosphoribosylglycinamide formyltransferase [Gemmatimonadales bacterium]